MKLRRIILTVLTLFVCFLAVGCKDKGSDNLPSLGEDAFAIHYQRTDNNYTNWGLWLWGDDNDGSLYEFNYKDSYGAVALYKVSGFQHGSGKIGFIVRQLDAWVKDVEADRFIELDTLTKDDKGIYHIYLKNGDKEIYTNSSTQVTERILTAEFTNAATVVVTTSVIVEQVDLYLGNTKISGDSGSGRKQAIIKVPTTHSIDFGGTYVAKATFPNGKTSEMNVSITGLYNTDAFNNLYYYDGDLGAIYSTTSTTFRVWSPFSTSIKLRVYANGTPVSVSSSKGSDVYTEYTMTKGEKGTWSYTLNGDQEGKYYTYFVTNSSYPNGKEIVDPYAKSCGVNGLRGMVVDFSKTNPAGWDTVSYLDYDRNSLTVYETHVADVTSSRTWGGTAANAKKFNGLVETGTTYTEGDVTVTTGFDHIKELGVNAVQLLPIFDQANDEVNVSFNWGYNPLNYNCVEGCYSSNPYDGYTRITELKNVIMQFNKAGITTIMDVVYNHVNGASGSNWDVLVPGYYYRYSNGALSNGSGCGNEVASENKMVRKFMIDSTKFWMEEYKLGGFRFDLMGLHDIETMNQLVATLNTVNPNAVVYGEPWTGGSTTLHELYQAKQDNVNKYVGYGQFNDQMRDALIKGGMCAKTEKGWITNNLYVTDVTNVVLGIQGATGTKTNDPNKTVNYATCHDNYTLYDRISAAGISDEATIKKMAMLANSVVFTSKGTTFMLAGEEFLRSKNGNSNSYNSSYRVNELDYSLKIENADMFANYKKLISLKQTCSGLQSSSTTDLVVESIENGAVLKYTVQTEGGQYLIIHANGAAKTETFNVEGYTLYLDTLGLSNLVVDNTVTISKYQTLIFYKAN